MAFVHLHTHSSYSPMWGVPTLEALCQAAQSQGQYYLALTDTNGLYGAIRYLEVAREHGLKPIIGAELVSDQHRAVLLAKNPTGYANLCRILSARHCDAYLSRVYRALCCTGGTVEVNLSPGWQSRRQIIGLIRRYHSPSVSTLRRFEMSHRLVGYKHMSPALSMRGKLRLTPSKKYSRKDGGRCSGQGCVLSTRDHTDPRMRP